MNLEALNLVGSSVALVDGRCERVEWASDAFREWTDIDAVGRCLAAIVPGFESKKAQRGIAKGRAFSVELLVTPAAGQDRLFEFRARPSTVDGRPVWIVLGTDISKVLTKQQMIDAYSTTIERNNKMLERQAEELARRNEAMRVVFDNVGQGLVTQGLDGSLGPERSAAYDAWFSPGPGDSLVDALMQFDTRVAETFASMWEQLGSGIFPTEVALDQLPRRIGDRQRQFRLDYKVLPSGEGSEPSDVLVVVSDITREELERSARREHEEFAGLFARALGDRDGVLEFVSSTSLTTAQVCAGGFDELVDLKRALHTLKGDAYLFGLRSVGDVCHSLEGEMAESGRRPSSDSLQRLRSAWGVVADKAEALELGGDGELWMTRGEHEALLDAVAARADIGELTRLLHRLGRQPVRARLERYARMAEQLAQRLGKAEISVIIECCDARFPVSSDWTAFWSSLGHVVRNAVDHGVETAEGRASAGKDSTSRLRIAAWEDPRGWSIEIRDDGAGVDWVAVEAKARAAGLPVATHDDLTSALLHDGMTTRSEVTDVSGRGVGLGAAAHACRALGGTLSIESTPGHGTTMRFRFPTQSTMCTTSAVAGPISRAQRSVTTCPSGLRR